MPLAYQLVVEVMAQQGYDALQGWETVLPHQKCKDSGFPREAAVGNSEQWANAWFRYGAWGMGQTFFFRGMGDDKLL